MHVPFAHDLASHGGKRQGPVISSFSSLDSSYFVHCFLSLSMYAVFLSDWFCFCFDYVSHLFCAIFFLSERSPCSPPVRLSRG